MEVVLSRHRLIAALIAVLAGLMPTFASHSAFADDGKVVADGRAPFHLVAEVPLVPDSKVGSRRAGLACLPHGSVRAYDFVSGPDDLLYGLQRELGRRGFAVDIAVGAPADMPQVVVRLDRIDASLCASSWGLGDRTRLKGRVAFTFSWHVQSHPRSSGTSAPAAAFSGAGQRAEVVIDTKTTGNRLRAVEFLPLALVQLSLRMTPPHG